MKYIVWMEVSTNKYWAAEIPDGSKYSVFMPGEGFVCWSIVVSKGHEMQDILKGAFVAEFADISSARSLVTRLRKVAKVMES